MSDVDLPSSRDAIADAVTADLGMMGQAQAPPEPQVSTPATTATQETGVPVTPATEPPAAVAPEALELTDKSLVKDPDSGEMKTWGEIKAERLRWKDYTQKRMADAELHRQYAAQEEQRQAQFDAWKAQQSLSAAPELPEDDPYAQRIRAIEAQQNAYLVAQRTQFEALESERVAAASSRLDADISRVSSEYKLDEREMDYVGREVLSKLQRGEVATIDDVAKQFVGYRTAQRELAIKEWKDKHSVGSPAAAVAVPATGTPEEMPVPGTRNFADRMLAELGISR